jgi:hypothetical protein
MKSLAVTSMITYIGLLAEAQSAQRFSFQALPLRVLRVS